MKKYLSLILTALFLVGCQSAARQTPVTTNTNTAAVQSGNSEIVSSHSTNTPIGSAPSANRTGSTESPMAKPIDVAEMTADIEKAEKEFKNNPQAKEDLAKAYFVRATALTGAAQYRAALGDYRKGLKLDPNDEEAKKMHDQIIGIFKEIGREPPKEGEEPPPLPFGK